jgi:hypothetical protein
MISRISLPFSCVATNVWWCTDLPIASIRDKVSATLLSIPLMCRLLVVNRPNWSSRQNCHCEHLTRYWSNSYIKGLWSVQIAISFPSTACLNSFTAVYIGCTSRCTARLTGAQRIGCANIVVSSEARFDTRKFFSDCSDHSMDALRSFVLYKKSLSGWGILAAPGMKRQ